MTSYRNTIKSLALLLAGCVAVAGCGTTPAGDPTTTGDTTANGNNNAQTNPNSTANNNSNGNNNNGNNNNNSSGNHVVTTDITVDFGGLVAVGDNIIAFGDNNGGVGVSYINVGDTTATKIPGKWRGNAVYCCGKKVILVANDDPKQISVFDTTKGTRVDVPGTDVWDISPGGWLENSYIAVDGNLVAILDRGQNGMDLKVIDVSGDTPVVTAFTTPFTNGDNVALDAAGKQVAVMEDNTFITVFPTNGAPDVQPTRFDLNAIGNVSIDYFPNIKISGGKVLFTQFSKRNVFLLDTTNSKLTQLSENPAEDDSQETVAINGGRLAYFLNRDSTDSDATFGDRVATADVASLTVKAASGQSLGGDGLLGFGHSVAIAPDGTIYIAGRISEDGIGGVIAPTALQVDTGSGFSTLTDSSGHNVIAADVVATNKLVAVKVDQQDVSATLSYYVTGK